MHWVTVKLMHGSGTTLGGNMSLGMTFQECAHLGIADHYLAHSSHQRLLCGEHTTLWDFQVWTGFAVAVLCD